MFIVSYVVLFIGGMLLCYGGFLLVRCSHYIPLNSWASAQVQRELLRAKGIAVLGGLLVVVGFVVCMGLEAMV